MNYDRIPTLSILAASILVMGFKRQKHETLVISKIWAYNYQQHWGLTSIGALNGFADAEKMDTLRIDDIVGLNKIFATVHPKKIFPAKLGVGIMFCGAVVGCNYHKIVICHNNLIIDYTTRKEYWVNDSASRSYLMQLNKNIRK